MIIIKTIFIIFLILFTLKKLTDEMIKDNINNINKVFNIIEIILGISLTIIIFKI